MLQAQSAGARVRSVFIQGCGKSGIAAMATIRALEASGRLHGSEPAVILGTDVSEPAYSAPAVAHYADWAGPLDSRDALATLELLGARGYGQGVDLVLATHNQVGGGGVWWCVYLKSAPRRERAGEPRAAHLRPCEMRNAKCGMRKAECEVRSKCKWMQNQLRSFWSSTCKMDAPAITPAVDRQTARPLRFSPPAPAALRCSSPGPLCSLR
jgi:hypothetical protein